MPTGHPADVNREEIIEMYQSGMSCNEIAHKIGYSESVVYKRLVAAEIPRRDKSSSQIGKHKRKKVRVSWQCPRCGKILQLAPSRARRRKFCSSSCAGKWRAENGLTPKKLPRPWLICLACGRSFQVKEIWEANIRKFCSPTCARYYAHTHSRRYANTTIERIIQALLLGMGINYVPQWRMGSFMVDIYLPDSHEAIECDGEYWHDLPETIKTDLKKERAFAQANISVLHLTEGEINHDIASCKKKIQNFLAGKA